jgi:cysteine desulfurase
MKTVYLDYAAATPLDTKVQAAMRPYFDNQFFNPSATYSAARTVHTDIEAARSSIAALLGARSSEIIFTAGGTEANNLAVHGIMQRYPDKKVIVSNIEHESVLAPAHQYDNIEAPVRNDGLIDVSALTGLIDDETVLVSVIYANNEVGTIQPLREIATVIRNVLNNRRNTSNHLPLYFHSDAAQAANYLDLHVSRLGLDMMSLNGGKIHGPKQSGLLWIRSGIELKPLFQGGGQERNVRSGTENVPGIIGLSVALEMAQAKKTEESVRTRALQQLFIELIKKKIPGSIVNGSLKKRLPNNVHITILGQDNERLLFGLDEAGIQAAAGSACSASSDKPSHVLRAMGISDADARSSLRFTLGRSTTQSSIRQTVDALARLIA